MPAPLARRKAPLLTALYLYLSGRCNLSCRHCWIEPEFYGKIASSSRSRKDEGNWLDPRELLRAIRQMLPLGLRSVKITGGEPLLYPFLARVIEQLRRLRLGLVLETNGTLVDAVWARLLGQCRCSQVAVSLDSDRAEEHNLFRGEPGAFERTWKGIRNLVSEGINTQVIIALWRGNRDRLAEIVRWADRQGVRSIKINPVTALGRGGGLDKQGQLLSGEEILAAFREIRRLRSQVKARILFDIPMVFHSLVEIREGVIGTCNLRSILGLLPDGRFSLCGMGWGRKELTAGRLGVDGVREIWEKSPLFRRVRREVPDQLEGICGRCLFRRRCQGKCRAEAYAETGRLQAAYSLCREAQQAGWFPQHRMVPGVRR